MLTLDVYTDLNHTGLMISKRVMNGIFFQMMVK